ncbi:MAG: glycosyltransferase [Lachnospiraceae bacterium]|nr:glycosyltransferase [Lachnospiraceae bacterium]
MKVMWIANLPLPEMAERIGVNSSLGGWLPALSSHLKEKENIEFVYCFPQNRTKALIQKKIGKVMFYGFYEDMASHTYDKKMEKDLKEIYMLERPDVVHLFGSEYYHAYAAVRSGIELDRMVMSIQGIMCLLAKHYCDGISAKDRLFPRMTKKGKIGCIEKEKKKFEMQGQYEGYVFRHIKIFEGRTDFDEAYVKIVNPSSKYFKCNRILRKKFYEGQWQAEAVEPYSVFLGQASYPPKGLHIFLQAISMLKELIPEIKVYIGGQNICQGKDVSSYGKYIEQIIKKYQLEDKITFLGSLCEEKMWEQFLKTNVFVLPSSGENSPNTLAEAMILGVPCIAADVGGVCSMMEHAKEGYIYRVDEPHMLAFYLYKLMRNRKLSQKFSENARRRALSLYDESENTRKVIEMYEDISKSKKC